MSRVKSAQSSRDVQIEITAVDTAIRRCEEDLRHVLPHQRPPIDAEIADLKAQLPPLKAAFTLAARREVDELRSEVASMIETLNTAATAAQVEAEIAGMRYSDAIAALDRVRHESMMLSNRIVTAERLCERYA